MTRANVLITDRSNPFFFELVQQLASYLEDSNIRVLFLSDKESSRIINNLEIINILDVSQNISLADLQKKYDFSLHKILVPERSFFDYSSFRKSQTYSRLNSSQIERSVTPYINALDAIIRERADIVIDGLADNFISSAAGQIARHYKKSFGAIFGYYWWNDGFLVTDRMDQTSTEVDKKYAFFYENFEQVDCEAMDSVFKNMKVNFQFVGGGVYPWGSRIKQILNRYKSYEPPSILNWIIRRLSWGWSRIQIGNLIPNYTKPLDEQFVLYPLHVSPEASMLGSSPELADQFGLIKNISMNLPYGVKLYVKEHPYQMVGMGLDYSFYKRVTELPNVRLFWGNIDIKGLWNDANCLAVSVLSGTPGLEAAINQKPVFIFGRPIYGVADCFIKPSNFQEFFQKLMQISRGEFKFDRRALYSILSALDASIVRAEGVKFDASKSWQDLSLRSLPIYLSYIESRINHKR